jgi:undecaprenyl-diphosphatase
LSDQLIQTIILAVIQGLTEWLPVSSTAHLIIAEQLMGTQVTPLFNVTLHVGTLVVIVFYFRRDLWEIIKCLFRLDFESEKGRLIPLIFVATIPTGVIGLLYVFLLEQEMQGFFSIGAALVVGGALVYMSRRGSSRIREVNPGKAFIVGSVQGLAVFPGLSRSGATISTSLLLGVEREQAIRFSFLLSIPAILGNLAVEIYQQRGILFLQGVDPMTIILGLIMTMATGYLSIALVKRLVLSERFHYLAFYTVTLGIVLIVYTLFA